LRQESNHHGGRGLREQMEEQADDRCNVVYFCASAGEDITALHHSQSPPDRASETQLARSLSVINQNVRALLDPDQGGFNEGERNSDLQLSCTSHETNTTQST
jgi:hypothetical protein